MIRARCIIPACLASGALAAAGQAQPFRLGAVGDSLTDEYYDDGFPYAKNWTLQLVENRGVDMGPTAAAAGQAGGTWGEPRRTGFKYNWARYGDTAEDALSNGQVSGVAGQVTANGLTHVVVAIGSNYFAPTSSAYFNIYWGFWSTATVDAYVNGAIADITDVVNTVSATQTGVVIGNVLDFGKTPVVRGLYGNASRRDRVTAAIARINAALPALAQQKKAVLIDLNAMATTILGPNASPWQFLPIGGVNIQLLNRDTTSHTVPLAGFVDDGGHPHTSLQGVFSNVLLAAFNTGWPGAGGGTLNSVPGGGMGFALYRDEEILAFAGITPAAGNPQTVGTVVGAYSQYITNYRCMADIGVQGGLSGADGLLDNNDFVVFIEAFFTLSPRADMGMQGGAPGADGHLDNNDFVVFIDRFFAGC